MPIQLPLGPAVRSFLAATVVALLCLGSPASAAECADGEDVGICLDDTTFQWCEGGELKTVNCPTGQVCVADNPWYDGAGCVATDKTDCEDISPQGQCTTANSVVWCDAGTPRVHACDEDSVCGWDEVTGEYDCLPTSNSAPSFGPDAASDDEADTSEVLGSSDASWSIEPDDIGPDMEDAPVPTITIHTPDVSTGETEDPNEDVTPSPEEEDNEGQPQPSSGCSGGGAPHGASLAILCLLALSCRRRGYSVTTA